VNLIRNLKKNLLYLLLCLTVACIEKKSKPVTVYAAANHTKAWAFYQRHETDSAYLYYTRAAAETKDRLVLAQIYATMAIIQSDQGDFYGSNETAVRSLKYFRQSDAYLPSVYNIIAINNYKQKDFRTAADWYRRAIAAEKDRAAQLLYRNNLAVTLTELKRYDEGIQLFRSLLTDPVVRSDTERYARALDNYHWARWKQVASYNALPGYLAALRLRLAIRDQWGQNAAYAHLADYYSVNRRDSALKYAELMYVTANALKSPDDQLEALQKLVQADSGRSANNNFRRYIDLQDSLLSARSAARNQFAVVRYETEKAKADNLNLQKDNSEQRYRLLRQQSILYGLLIAVAVAAVFVTGFIRRRQARLQQEAAERLRAQQHKTSKRVHDVLANDLYRIMSDLDNGSAGDAAELAGRLEVLYQRARDLSYEDEPVPLENFEIHLNAMLNSFRTERTRVLPDHCTAAFWQGTTGTVRQEVSLVLLELMVNMHKHSEASLVTVAFRRAGKHCSVIYTDNGIGMPAVYRPGNGIAHTENRMSAIGGSITFETGRENGLQVQLSFSAV
jgi:signal transduction histidine kinase